mgnify:FL=1
MDKLNNKIVGFALATTSAILYLICAVFIWLFPKGTMNYANYMLHNIDLGSIASKTMTLGNTIIGLILIFVSGYLVGILFASLYNYFNKKN